MMRQPRLGTECGIEPDDDVAAGRVDGHLADPGDRVDGILEGHRERRAAAQGGGREADPPGGVGDDPQRHPAQCS
jgi:hypothetical protein